MTHIVVGDFVHFAHNHHRKRLSLSISDLLSLSLSVCLSLSLSVCLTLSLSVSLSVNANLFRSAAPPEEAGGPPAGPGLQEEASGEDP